MSIRQLRALWVAYTLLASVVVGSAGGVLAFLGGDHPAHAVMAGAATFAAATTIGLLILTFVGQAPHDRHDAR